MFSFKNKIYFFIRSQIDIFLRCSDERAETTTDCVCMLEVFYTAVLYKFTFTYLLTYYVFDAVSAFNAK